MTCWTILGLTRDADERAVKRAYAALLKQHRPDADPEGFRRINDAYQQALAHAAMIVRRSAAGVTVASVTLATIRPPRDGHGCAGGPR